MRHLVNVMRPTKATGSLGELQGQPEVVIPNWPCSIKTLSGGESVAARQNTANATLEVQGWGNPRKPIAEGDYLIVLPETDPPRKLNIEFIDDKKQNGIELTLLCGE